MGSVFDSASAPFHAGSLLASAQHPHALAHAISHMPHSTLGLPESFDQVYCGGGEYRQCPEPQTVVMPTPTRQPHQRVRLPAPPPPGYDWTHPATAAASEVYHTSLGPVPVPVGTASFPHGVYFPPHTIHPHTGSTIEATRAPSPGMHAHSPYALGLAARYPTSVTGYDASPRGAADAVVQPPPPVIIEYPASLQSPYSAVQAQLMAEGRVAQAEERLERAHSSLLMVQAEESRIGVEKSLNMHREQAWQTPPTLWPSVGVHLPLPAAPVPVA